MGVITMRNGWTNTKNYSLCFYLEKTNNICLWWKYFHFGFHVFRPTRVRSSVPLLVVTVEGFVSTNIFSLRLYGFSCSFLFSSLTWGEKVVINIVIWSMQRVSTLQSFWAGCSWTGVHRWCTSWCVKRPTRRVKASPPVSCRCSLCWLASPSLACRGSPI